LNVTMPLNDDRSGELTRERQLRGEGGPLDFTRRVIVVVVEAALANRNGAALALGANAIQVSSALELRRVVRVNAGGVGDEFRMQRRECACARRSLERLADAHDGPRASLAGPLHNDLAVRVERGIREVRV
jgi:hypothetical protein